MFLITRLIEKIRKAGSKVLLWNLTDSYVPEGKEIETLEDAVRWFPAMKDMRDILIERGIIKSEDYTGRCGNCHELLEPADKYCRFCGTKRGEGAFHPFWNPMMVAYGPPYLRKHKCDKCSHIWIDSVLSSEAAFCPACGGSGIRKQSEREAPFLFGFFGTRNPYDSDLGRPLLFDRSQVKLLLSERGKEPSCDIASCDQAEYIYALAKKVGVEVTGKIADHGFTELEGDQLAMIENIMTCKGNEENHAALCPACESDMTAVIDNSPRGKENQAISDRTLQIKAEDLIEHSGSFARMNDDRKLLFLCLCCGNIFSVWSTTPFSA